MTGFNIIYFKYIFIINYIYSNEIICKFTKSSICIKSLIQVQSLVS